MRTYTVTEYEMEDYNNFRNNLTIEETINLLKYINRGYIGDYNFTGSEDDFDRYKLHAALYNAIEILEKMNKE